MAKISDARHELLSLNDDDKFLVDDGENKKIKAANVKETLGINALSVALSDHKADATNPHGVTKAHVGLGNVANKSEAELVEVGAIADALAQKSSKVTTQQNTDGINALSVALSDHKADATNPHGVTKAHVGLGNVDNTRDVDKPISNPQKNAIVNNFSGGVDKFAGAVETKTLHERSLMDIDGQPYIITRTSKNGHIIKTVSLYVEAI